MSVPDRAEREQFSRLFDEHYDALTRFAARSVGPADAQDVVADTFLVAWRRRYDIPRDSLPWLIGVARNVLFQQYRASARRVALTAELEATRRMAADPEQVVERQWVLRALAGLSASDRELLVLTAWEGLSPRQAAVVIGCSSATLRVRLHRARHRFAAALAAAEHVQLPAPPTNSDTRTPDLPLEES